jgi:hypothetical protein
MLKLNNDECRLGFHVSDDRKKALECPRNEIRVAMIDDDDFSGNADDASGALLKWTFYPAWQDRNQNSYQQHTNLCTMMNRFETHYMQNSERAEKNDWEKRKKQGTSSSSG